MNYLKIRPLSVNEYQGTVRKAWVRNDYKAKVKAILNPFLNVPVGDKELRITVGFSSIASDLDNIFKPFIDTLAEYYKFDDKTIKRIVADKVIIPKGEEFIEFDLVSYCPYATEHVFILGNKTYLLAANIFGGCNVSIKVTCFELKRNKWFVSDIANVPKNEIEAMKEKLLKKVIKAVEIL